MATLDELKARFEELKKSAKTKATTLNEKKLNERLRKKYNERFGSILKIYGDDNSTNELRVSKAIREMEDLDKILDGEVKRLESGTENIENLKRVSDEEFKDNKTAENKVKSYIKSKIGNTRYFETKVVEYSTLYKGKDEFMPLEEMREIYGSKGALMMICRLEDGNVGRIKLFSTYRRFCDQILKNYRSLKVEAAIESLERGEIVVSDVGEEDAKELNNMLHELNELEGLDTSKFPLIDSGNKKFSFSKFFSSTKSQIAKLKNTQGNKNKGRKKLIDKVVKKIREIENTLSGDFDDIDASVEKDKYIKKYNAFVEKSAKLAVTYLKTEGRMKIRRFSLEGKKKGFFEVEIPNKRRDLSIDACKIALMCLVAVCSKNEKYTNEGKNYFRKIKPYLINKIG